LDRLKGFAFLWVLLDHVVERMIGGAYANNPTFDWPPLGVRLAQFATVRGAGPLDWPLTIVRDFGWFGDVGVTLFVIASGFGLTYGTLANGQGLDVATFYRRRAFRIFPLWWGAHVLFLPWGLLTGGLSTGDWHFYADLAGLRFLPGMFYYFSPAWWYVGLILQLYLVFPLLWGCLRRYGATALLCAGCGLGFVALALGPLLFHSAYLDAWQRGAFFVTRLPEFVTGMVLAQLWFARPARAAALVRTPAVWLGGVAACAAGVALSFTLPGMIVAPLLLGAGSLGALFPLVIRGGERGDALQWLGRKSYPLYLVHHPFVLVFVPASGAIARAAFGVAGALGGTFAAALVLERGTAWVEAAFGQLRARRGARAAAAAFAAAALGVVLVPVCADLAVAAFDPQEVNGWGERASLEPDGVFGWKLIPSRTTRLRWESYDYRVTSNALGFPAPQFSVAKPPHALRILVTGDAFSSAEGVDTPQAWPRLLQTDLQRQLPNRRVEVLNFAITGYSPNQEAAAVRAFAPRYHPDLVLVEYFAHAFAGDAQDVLASDDQLRASIGFDQPSQTGLSAVFSLAQLRAWLHDRVVDPLASIVKHRPAAEGYFLGNFTSLERGGERSDGEVIRKTATRFEEIARAARASGGSAIVAFVPPPVAVCDARALRYYPRYVDLADRTRYDVDLPDRRAARIAALANVELWDLRPSLRALPACPYMPRNLHFTVEGHRAVADLLARRIAALRLPSN
jgi:peptidoglycan/LPS O-acetylase OafA/YrhL/lysophospholipase L1-like esterase